MPTFRTGLAREVSPEEALTALLQPEEEAVPPGFKKLLTPEGDPYYVPTGLAQPGEEVPIPEVSLPDVPKVPITEPEPLPPSKPIEVPTKPSSYDVTPPETVPETPNEQLEKLKPPEEPPPPPPEPQPITEPEPMSKALETLTKGFFAVRKATEPVRQVFAKPLGGVAAIPWMIPAGFEAIRGLQHQDETERKISSMNAAWLQEQGLGAYKAVHKILGAEQQPETGVEHVAGSLASSYVPGHKLATGMMFGANELVRMAQGAAATTSPQEKRIAEWPPWFKQAMSGVLSTEAGAGQDEDRAAALERLKLGQGARPGVTPATAPVTGAPKKGKKGPTMVPVSPEAQQAKPIEHGQMPPPVPPIGAVTPDTILRRPGNIKQKKNELPADFLKRVKEHEARQEAFMKQFNPSAVSTMKTVGGMKEAKDSDLWGIGIMGIGTAGMIAMPYVYKGFRAALMPKPMSADEAAAKAKPVPGAAPGTISNVSTLDTIKAVTTDVNLAAVRQAEKAMMHPDKVANLEQMLRSGGHTQGQALIDSAITNGKMRTNTMDFETPRSLERIGATIAQVDQQMGNKNATRYLIVRDILERITLKEAEVAQAGNKTVQELGQQLGKAGKRVDVTTLSPKAGPDAEIRINGLTKDDALNTQGALETMNPDLKKLGVMWDRWNIDKRKFLADGEAATMTKDDQKTQNYGQKSEIPWGAKVGEETPLDYRVNQTNITDAQNYQSRTQFKKRLQNEIRLLWVDSMRAINEGYATRISEAQFRGNPEYKPYTIEVFRRGKSELYTVDRTTRDFLNLDPYIIEGGFSTYMHNAKRVVENVYTGHFNPAFAFKNALRVWHGAKQNAIEGRYTPSIYGMSRSVVDQVYPQLGKFIVDKIEDGGGKRLSQFLGKMQGMTPEVAEAARLAMGRRMAAKFDDHLYYAVEQHGGARGSLQEQQHRTAEQAKIAIAKGDQAMANAGDAAKRYWDYFKRGYLTTLNAVHESPQFNYVQKNMGKGIPLDQLIAEARNLGGDPKIGGQFRFSEREDRTVVGKPGARRSIAFEGNTFQNAAVKTAGVAADVIRHGPWGNAIIQSVRRVGAAYLENPALFTGKMYAYTVAPAAMSYLWSYQNGLDPNGKSYAEYHANLRNKYASMTSMYVAIPGLPRERGLEIPMVALEYALAHGMTLVAMDHMFGQNKIDLRTDVEQALRAAVDISLNIPLNPFLQLWEVSQGRIPPLNIIGGESIKPSKDPYDQFRTMPEMIERYVRNLGGIGAAVGEGYAAYSHTEEGFATALKNGVKGAALSQVRQIPIMNALFDVQPKMSGTNKVTEEFFDDLKHIDEIVKHYRTKVVKGGMINTTPASKLGGVTSTMELGPPDPGITPGPPQPEPNDPLYNEFMSTVYARFKRDNPGYSKDGEDLGGVGFLSLIRRYGQATKAIKSMEYVDIGMQGGWQKWMNNPENAELVTTLKEHNVDTTNAREVRNYYETKRQAAGLTLHYYIRAVENELTAKKRAGIPERGIPPDPNASPVRLRDIKPYTWGNTESQFADQFSGAGMYEQ